MSEAKSYTPGNLQRSFRKLQSKHKRAIINFLNAKVSTEDLFAYLWRVQDFNPVAAETWLDRIELENIYYKSDNHSFYDPRQISPVVEVIFDKYPKHPLSIWISARDGYRTAYKSATQNNASYEILDPVSPVASEPTQEAKTPLQRTVDDVMRRSQFHVKVDPHMIRAAEIIGKCSPDWSEPALIRLYYIVRHIDTWRDGQKGQGHVTLKELRSFLKAAGLYTKQSLYRWIADGVEAGYWIHARSEKRLHYRSLKAVAAMLMKCLPDDVIADFRGNQALGGRMVWVDVRGKLGAFKGQILGAWLEQRAKDDNGLTIQNQTIADMWNVSVRTVQYWREAAKIPHVANYTETSDPAMPIRRIPNTYFSPDDTREHSHTGQSRKVRKIANRELTERGFSPDSYGDVGEAKQHRLTFVNSEKMTAFEALAQYRKKHGKPIGQAQHALIGLHTVKAGVIGLYQECF